MAESTWSAHTAGSSISNGALAAIMSWWCLGATRAMAASNEAALRRITSPRAPSNTMLPERQKKKGRHTTRSRSSSVSASKAASSSSLPSSSSTHSSTLDPACGVAVGPKCACSVCVVALAVPATRRDSLLAALITSICSSKRTRASASEMVCPRQVAKKPASSFCSDPSRCSTSSYDTHIIMERKIGDL